MLQPTTGMDPANRRGVWKVLQEQKQAGVNVVMTTHSMEEADILGDTIGIMADGKLEAFGPSLELKRKYGLLAKDVRKIRSTKLRSKIADAGPVSTGKIELEQPADAEAAAAPADTSALQQRLKALSD